MIRVTFDTMTRNYLNEKVVLDDHGVRVPSPDGPTLLFPWHRVELIEFFQNGDDD